MTDLPAMPESPAATFALETVTAFSSPAMVNHCRRAYLWAADYGLERGVPFDAEVLYVSSMLHDLGLAESFDNHTVDFEQAGGNVAWVFAAGAGWPVERRAHASRVIVDHMRADVTADENTEGWLLMIATSWDIAGRGPDEWSDELKRAVLARHPRLDLAAEFLRCFADQARRKPACSAAESVASGIAARMAAHPLEDKPVS